MKNADNLKDVLAGKVMPSIVSVLLNCRENVGTFYKIQE